MSTPDIDIVVAGGGMVGSLLAAALATPTEGGPPPPSVVVLEAAVPAPFDPGSEPPYDIRVSALSVASERMFRNVGAWDGIVSRRAAPFDTMRVWDGTTEPRGHTTFSAEDIDEPALGHIVENRVIQLALLDRLAELPNVTLRTPATLEHFVPNAAGTGLDVVLAGGETIGTRLLVGADGARSTVRKVAGIACPREPYDQRALVATVDTEASQQSVTWQRFMPTGPQALLPLTGARASLVWYHTHEEVKRLTELDDGAFLEALHGAFPADLGRVTRVRERSSFPIAKAHAKRYIADRVALIGDAAHTVHPLAGQGVNLGMLDAGALSETLLKALAAGRDPGSERVLRGYERWRRPDNALMIEVLDGFHRAFGPQAGLIERLRGFALDVADKAGPAKRLVSRYAMGLDGDLPELAR